MISVVAAVDAASRAERELYGAFPPDELEAQRRFGVRIAARWLSDPRQTIGPLADGPASSADRVQRELDLARSLIPSGVSRFPRYAPAPRRGERQRWEAEVLGIVQALEYALGQVGEIPGLVTVPSTGARHAA